MNESLNVIRNHYADFSGRARRREAWMFALINAVISLVLALPYTLATATATVSDAEFAAAPGGLALVSVALVVLVPTVAVTVRRLHGTGANRWGHTRRSGWRTQRAVRAPLGLEVLMPGVLNTALVLGAALALTPGAGAQNDCDRPNGSFDQVCCQIKVLVRADADMNAAYTLLLKQLTPAAQTQLRQTRRAWLARRDRDCVEYSASRGDVVYCGCAAKTTTERLHFLNDRLRECDSSGRQPSRLR